ncbi:MAG TPA: hypothetical protein VFD35_10850 [Pricia sp.]|nr:hypothetical protein [Pricia sp.]
MSINTTNIYAEVDLKMKSEALACCEIEENRTPTHWKDDKDLMTFLDNLQNGNDDPTVEVAEIMLCRYF